MRKIFEERFRSLDRAVEYVGEANWDYRGGRGFLLKHDRYQGSVFYREYGDLNATEYEHRFLLKLFPDGYVALYLIKGTSPSQLVGISSLPEFVWHSKAERDFKVRLTDLVNETLQNEQSKLSVLFHNHPSKFPLVSSGSIEPIDTLDTPLKAIDYRPGRKKLSDKAEQILYRAVNERN